MIVLVSGQPGSGKSYYAVRQLVGALNAGKFVATNVALADGWQETVAKQALGRRLIPGRVGAAVKAYNERTFISADLDELFRLRLEGSKEGRGVMVLDEAHNWLNARTWDADDSGEQLTKAEAIQRRLSIVRFFSQHRKLGWDVFLITQDVANLDRQVRSLFEYHCKLRNLRNLKVMGIRVIPAHFFVAIWGWNDVSKAVVKRDYYRLDRKVARLYDTLALSHGLDVDRDDAIMLPRRPADRTAEVSQPAAPAQTAVRPAGAAPASLPLASRIAVRLRPRAAAPADPTSSAGPSPFSLAGAPVAALSTPHAEGAARHGDPSPVAFDVEPSEPVETIAPVWTVLAPINAESPEFAPPGFPDRQREQARDGQYSRES